MILKILSSDSVYFNYFEFGKDLTFGSRVTYLIKIKQNIFWKENLTISDLRKYLLSFVNIKYKYDETKDKITAVGI